MLYRWLWIAVVLFAVSAITVSAMPTEPETALGEAPAYDIRPFLEANPLPDEVLAQIDSMPAYRPRPYGPAAQPYDVLLEDFEGVALEIPRKWIVFDLDDEINGEYKWGLSKCRKSKGEQSLWALAAGDDGKLLECGAQYPHGASSVAILRLDLGGWPESVQELSLAFDIWLNTRSDPEGGVVGDGLFISYRHVLEDGTQRNIVVKALTSQFPEDWWQTIELDLLDVYDIYDEDPEHYNLAGKGDLLIQFLFKSKTEPGGELTEGAFMDEVRLRASHAPTPSPTVTWDPTIPTPTVTPTMTPTATSTFTPTPIASNTPTPTDTPLVTDTPTATATPEVQPVYLPIAANGEDEGPMPPLELLVALAEVDASGVSGQATLKPGADGLEVAIQLDGTPPDGVHPTHIHLGSCDELGDVAHPLEDVVDGMSMTTLAGVSLGDVADGAHAINVHLSADEMATNVACGTIQDMDATPPSPRPWWHWWR